MYMLDYVLPQVAKLSKTLQTEHFDLSMVSILVDATLNTLDDTVLTSANWVQTRYIYNIYIYIYIYIYIALIVIDY